MVHARLHTLHRMMYVKYCIFAQGETVQINS